MRYIRFNIQYRFFFYRKLGIGYRNWVYPAKIILTPLKTSTFINKKNPWTLAQPFKSYKGVLNKRHLLIYNCSKCYLTPRLLPRVFWQTKWVPIGTKYTLTRPALVCVCICSAMQVAIFDLSTWWNFEVDSLELCFIVLTVTGPQKCAAMFFLKVDSGR